MLVADKVKFWGTLVEGRTVQSIVPRQRWDVDAFYDPDGGSGKMYTRIAATIQVSPLSHTLTLTRRRAAPSAAPSSALCQPFS